MTLVTLDDALVFRARLGQPQHRSVVLLGLVGHGQGRLETWEENDVLVGGELVSQRIEFRPGVLDERLPVDFGDRDALQRIDLHRGLIGTAHRQGPFELQVLADRPAAGEEFVGRGKFILLPELIGIAPCLGNVGGHFQLGPRQALLMAEPGPAGNITRQQVIVMGQLRSIEGLLGLGFSGRGGNGEPQDFHTRRIGLGKDQPALDLLAGRGAEKNM